MTRSESPDSVTVAAVAFGLSVHPKCRIDIVPCWPIVRDVLLRDANQKGVEDIFLCSPQYYPRYVQPCHCHIIICLLTVITQQLHAIMLQPGGCQLVHSYGNLLYLPVIRQRQQR